MTPTYAREARVEYIGQRKRMPTMRCSSDVAGWLRQHALPADGRERFVAIALDAKHTPMAWHVVSVGGLAVCPVEPAQVFRFAILQGAKALVIAHNHPSGDPHPSPEDRALTRRLADAGKLFGIKVLDHVVVGDAVFADETPQYFSFLDAGMLA